MYIERLKIVGPIEICKSIRTYINERKRIFTNSLIFAVINLHRSYNFEALNILSYRYTHTASKIWNYCTKKKKKNNELKFVYGLLKKEIDK